MIEQIKEFFKITIISLTSIFVILFVLLLVIALHVFKLARKITHFRIFRKQFQEK